MNSAQSPPTEKYVYCPLCDYNLHGLDDGNCPECGEPFEREMLKQSRVGRKESFREVVGTLIGWPIMVWLAVVPAIGIICLPLVMLLIVMTGSEYIGIVSASMAGVIVLGTVLLHTALISKDLARQTHRILRFQSPDKDNLSASTLFWLFIVFELFAMLLVPFTISLFIAIGVNL